MTQKEKLMKARLMAMRVKSLADTLRFDAKNYDVRFPLIHAKKLEEIADEFLNMK